MSKGARYRMAGKRRYRCLDCNYTFFAYPERVMYAQTQHTRGLHCQDCGSTMIEPDSKQAHKDEISRRPT